MIVELNGQHRKQNLKRGVSVIVGLKGTAQNAELEKICESDCGIVWLHKKEQNVDGIVNHHSWLSSSNLPVMARVENLFHVSNVIILCCNVSFC